MARLKRYGDIYLLPGDVYFGDRETRIRTILGSCVSLAVWHPQLRVGGMCHFMLPGRITVAQTPLDGRYANEAMEILLLNIDKVGAPISEYRLKIVGGGNMFPGIVRTQSDHIGSRNVLRARELTARHGFECVAEHVEGSGHRHLIFDVLSGVLSLRHTAVKTSENQASIYSTLLPAV